MTATVCTPTTAASTARPSVRHSLLRATAIATVVAAAATELLVALVKAAGADVAIQGKALGFGGCAIALLMCMVPAVGLIAGVRRWAASPARAWVRITVPLTVLSFVPDLAVASTSTGSRLTLMGAHVVAAAIVIPLVARKLPATR